MLYFNRIQQLESFQKPFYNEHNDDIDNDVSERRNTTIAPFVFFTQGLNATKDITISGHITDHNPFDFDTNEFNVSHRSKSQHNENNDDPQNN